MVTAQGWLKDENPAAKLTVKVDLTRTDRGDCEDEQAFGGSAHFVDLLVDAMHCPLLEKTLMSYHTWLPNQASVW